MEEKGELEYVCQLGEGYMLCSIGDKFTREYTGYPYPDTKLCNIEALRGIFRAERGSKLWNDIDINPKLYINSINTVFTRNGNNISRSDLVHNAMFLKSAFVVVAAYEDWLFVRDNSLSLEFMEECTDVYNEGEPFNGYIYFIVHRSHSMAKRMGVSDFSKPTPYNTLGTCDVSYVFSIVLGRNYPVCFTAKPDINLFEFGELCRCERLRAYTLKHHPNFSDYLISNSMELERYDYFDIDERNEQIENKVFEVCLERVERDFAGMHGFYYDKDTYRLVYRCVMG